MRMMSFSLRYLRGRPANNLMSAWRMRWQFAHSSTHFEASRTNRCHEYVEYNLLTLHSLSLFGWWKSNAIILSNPQSTHFPPNWSVSFFLSMNLLVLCAHKISSRFDRYFSRRILETFSRFFLYQLFRLRRTFAGLFSHHRLQANLDRCGNFLRHLRLISRTFSLLASRYFLTLARDFLGFFFRHAAIFFLLYSRLARSSS